MLKLVPGVLDEPEPPDTLLLLVLFEPVSVVVVEFEPVFVVVVLLFDAGLLSSTAGVDAAGAEAAGVVSTGAVTTGTVSVFTVLASDLFSLLDAAACSVCAF